MAANMFQLMGTLCSVWSLMQASVHGVCASSLRKHNHLGNQILSCCHHNGATTMCHMPNSLILLESMHACCCSILLTEAGFNPLLQCRSAQASWATHPWHLVCVTPSPATPQQTAPTMVLATPPPLLANVSLGSLASTALSPLAYAVPTPPPTALQLAATPPRSAAALALLTAMAHAVTQVCHMKAAYMPCC